MEEEFAGAEKLRPLSWREINDPGAYVELTTGDLFRVPKEALVPGSSLVVRRESKTPSKFVQISADPLISSLEARLMCLERKIKPNF